MNYATGLANALSAGAVAYGDQTDKENQKKLLEAIQARHEQRAEAELAIQQQRANTDEERRKSEELRRGTVPGTTDFSTQPSGTPVVTDPFGTATLNVGAPKPPKGAMFNADGLSVGNPSPLPPDGALGPALQAGMSPPALADAPPPPPSPSGIPTLERTDTPMHYDPSQDADVQKEQTRQIMSAWIRQQQDSTRNAAQAARDSVRGVQQATRDSTLEAGRNRRGDARNAATLAAAGLRAQNGANSGKSPYTLPLDRAVASGIGVLTNAGDPVGADPTNPAHVFAATKNVVRADPKLRQALQSGQISMDDIQGAVASHMEKHKQTLSDVKMKLMKSVLDGPNGGTKLPAPAAAPTSVPPAGRPPAPKTKAPVAPTIVPTEQEMNAALDAGITDYSAARDWIAKRRTAPQP